MGFLAVVYPRNRVKSIKNQTLNLPSEAPIMVLPGALLFPHALLPLYIFEPRYRAMLAHALERDRMFCIAQTRPGVEEAEWPEDFCDVSTVGLVRACVGQNDGTSHLVLQGLARVRFRAFVQERPFRVAQIEELGSVTPNPQETDLLTRKLLQLCSESPVSGPEDRKKFEEQLHKISDPGILGDIVAHTFLRDAGHRQDALDALDVNARLKLVAKYMITEFS